jgi:hypothetical protein
VEDDTVVVAALGEGGEVLAGLGDISRVSEKSVGYWGRER